MQVPINPLLIVLVHFKYTPRENASRVLKLNEIYTFLIMWKFKFQPHATYRIYMEVLTFVERFTTLRFTATGATPAARRIRILPMNQ
jgi:hypothetical protein